MAKFKAGVSGNPLGRKQGSRNRALIWLDKIGEDNAASVLHAMIRKAKQGDVTAGTLLLSRVWPARRGRPICIALPPIVVASDVPKALSAVTAALANGELTADEAVGIASVIEAARRSIELTEIERRLTALEAK